MITITLVTLLTLFLVYATVFFLAKLIKRARKKKAFAGAAFWLTSFWLCVVFVFIGIGWGLCVGLFKL